MKSGAGERAAQASGLPYWMPKRGPGGTPGTGQANHGIDQSGKLSSNQLVYKGQQ